ncbi:MAG TPA: copper-translocating P-type ATPase [Nitrososphaeraceae archaeon]|nr:copper-translocating P-type ATPase [Nitrososphaeraceae archaeon]
MKKKKNNLSNKMLNERETKEEEGKSITCECCMQSLPAQAKEHQGDIGVKERNEDHSRSKLLIIIGLSLTIPLVLLEIFYDSAITHYILLALATPVQFILGKPFYLRFFRALRLRHGFTTDTLVVLSTSVAYSYSLFSLLADSATATIFFEASASVLTIFTIGEYLEGRVIRTTSESIKNLLALRPKTAVVIRKNDKKGKEEEEIVVDADSIVIGDIVVAKPGDKIAADGVVVYGESSVDESMITGESIPVDKKIGDKVIGATINKNGYIRFRATAVGSHTILASIIEMVERARVSKAPIQRIAGKAVRYFIPIVLFIAAASSIYWLFIAEQSIAFAITIFATVLVVSCPCALGIATPMVVSLGIDKAAREGVLIKGGEYLEKLANIDTVIFDKTGTLTKGKPEVTDVISNNNNNNGYNQYEILQIASSLENRSEHPIAQAIINKAFEQSIPTLEVSQFNSISGHGIMAFYQEKRIFVGSPTTSIATTLNNGSSIIPQRLQSEISKLEAEGKTVVAVYIEDKLVGLIAVADTLREDAKHTIDEIKQMNKEVILISGDNERTANAIANKLGINNVLAQVMPETKAQEVKKLQDQGKKVAMIGDGINDAPALTQADVGIAMSSGTDVAMSSGHVILMKSDLYHVLSAFKIGQYSFKKIKQNLAMSFAYNAITISIAAGLLYGVTHSVILTPALAALGWIISDSAVFGNSLLVRKFIPNNFK